MTNRRKKYDPEFKRMIVELFENGKSAIEISEEFEIGKDLVYQWKNALQKDRDQSFPGNGKVNRTPEQEEIHQLKKALREAQLERDILKKAVTIFSKNDNRHTN